MLKYQRWLQPSEHFNLMPDFLSIILSRRRANCPLYCFSVWMSDQKDPFELIDEWEQINQFDVELLAHKSRIEGEDLLRVVHRVVTGIPISTIAA